MNKLEEKVINYKFVKNYKFDAYKILRIIIIITKIHTHLNSLLVYRYYKILRFVRHS